MPNCCHTLTLTVKRWAVYSNQMLLIASLAHSLGHPTCPNAGRAHCCGERACGECDRGASENANNRCDLSLGMARPRDGIMAWQVAHFPACFEVPILPSRGMTPSPPLAVKTPTQQRYSCMPLFSKALALFPGA